MAVEEKRVPKFNPHNWLETKQWIQAVENSNYRFVWEAFQSLVGIYSPYKGMPMDQFKPLWEQTVKDMWLNMAKRFPQEVSAEFPDKIVG